MKESSTIVIPIQFKSKKKWKKFDKQIFEELQLWNKVKDYKWKKLKFTDVDDSNNYLDVVAAFDGDNNKKEREEAYFYDEAYRTLYDEKGVVSSTYLLAKNEKVVMQDNDLYVSFGECTRKIRKLYLYLTNSHIALLIVELEAEETTRNNIDMNAIVDLERKLCIISKDKKIEEDLLEWTLGLDKDSKEFCYELPFRKECFLATYKIDENISSETSDNKELDINNVDVNGFVMSGHGTDNELHSFFGHYFQIFWLCILQKTEILHISHMAGRISRKANLFLVKGDIEKVNKEYVLFYNQYDLIECTYDEMGEKLYKKIRENMNINQGNIEVREQMKTLHEYAVLLTGKRTNFWLTLVSIVCSALAIIEFCIKLFSAGF